MINFFDDERLSDITVTFSGKKISAHKIILATHLSHFQELLGGSSTVSYFVAHPYRAIELI